jgi:ParB family chromosome partitioning protein
MDSSEDKKRKNLGRGLSALFGDDDSNTDIEKDIHLYSSSREEISIDDIVPNPYQPREYFDCSELEGLVASIKEKGIIQPIIVRKAENCDGLYQIIAGERRWKASKIAGLKMIPTVIRESGDEEMLSLAMIENIQRSNLNPIEEAKGFDAMLKVNNTQKEISSIVGKSRSYVANSLRLLTLPRDVQKFLESGERFL